MNLVGVLVFLHIAILPNIAMFASYRSGRAALVARGGCGHELSTKRRGAIAAET